MNKYLKIQNDSDKLIFEFKELKEKYNNLQNLYEEKIAEQDLSEKALSKLNQFSVELLNLSPLDNLEVIISKMIKEITGAKAAVFSHYDPAGKCLNVHHVELEAGLLEKVLKLVGKQIKKISAPVSDDTYKLMTTEVIGYRETLHEASFGSISKPVSAAIQKLLKVNRFIGIVYLIENKFYGTTLLALSKDQPDPPRQILKNIIFLAAVTLKRKKNEETIHDSEERFRILFEGSPDAIFLTDPVTCKVLCANTSASLLLMKKDEEVIGMNLNELHLSNAEHASLNCEKLSDKVDFFRFTPPVESSIQRSDGKLISVEISARMTLYKGRKVLMSSFRNISELKQSNLNMQQVFVELQTLIENMQQGILLENENRSIQFANKKFCELFGIPSPGDIIGVDCLALAQQAKEYFASPDDFIRSIEKRLQQKTVMLSEEMLLADGRIFERDYIPILKDGKKSKNYWVYRDITERKHAEISLRESQSQISALLKAIPDLLFIQTPDGTYIDYHAPEGSPLYVPADVFIGKNMNEILPADIVVEFWKVFKSAIETRMVQNFEYSLQMPDGLAYFESRTVAYTKEKILSLIRDITERKKAEFKIQLQIQELKKLNEDKDRFMSILAHDLKSPFNSILGLLTLLSEKLNSFDIAKTEKLINTIKYSAEHFYQLLERLLLWARAQSGKMPFEPQIEDLTIICKEVIEEVSLNADAKNITVRFLPDSDNKVFADIEMLKTILRNLISNAIKFTHKGGHIEISIRNDSDMARIEVSDNGIGISLDKIQTLFDIASSHKLKGTDGESGTGLGLFLCKELVEKHGGILSVESIPEQGSSFIFTLPKRN